MTRQQSETPIEFVNTAGVHHPGTGSTLAEPESVDSVAAEDDRLMYLLQGGDRLAFERLVTRYQNSLAGFFFRHLRDWQLVK